MRRDSKLVRGLVNWLLGGISARLDFIEHDVEALQENTRELTKGHKAITQVVASHHVQLRQQADQMIALRRMHGLLAEKIGKPFPGSRCEICGSEMVFERVSSEKAYALQCPDCDKTLLLPEANLLNTIAKLEP